MLKTSGLQYQKQKFRENLKFTYANSDQNNLNVNEKEKK